MKRCIAAIAVSVTIVTSFSACKDKACGIDVVVVPHVEEPPSVIVVPHVVIPPPSSRKGC